MEPATSLDTSAVLAAMRRAQSAVRSAEVEVLVNAVEWARLHEVDPDSYEAARWEDTPVLLAGEGAPAVSEYCLAELGAALGISTEAGRRYLAHALELEYRLPKVYARVLAGNLPVWRARRIAESTSAMSLEAAGFLDAALAPTAHKDRDQGHRPARGPGHRPVHARVGRTDR